MTSKVAKTRINAFECYQKENIFFYDKTEAYFEFSNFFPRPIEIDGLIWPSSEHYYQAQKFKHAIHKEIIRTRPTPLQAFQFGQMLDVERIKNWDKLKVAVMRKALYEKFRQHRDLQLLLINTKNAVIKEKSLTDSFWGVGYDQQGQNQLGRLLMELRRDFLDTAKLAYQQEDEILQISQAETFPYELMISGKSYMVMEQVFSPKYFPDVDFFAESLPIPIDASVLEIGTGIGFTAITAIYRGAKQVIATDINPFAVHNARKNVEQHKMQTQIEVREGSVFKPILPREKFDVIYWNVPFQFLEAGMPRSILQLATCDIGYHYLEEYISLAWHYLKPNGRLFLGFSRSLGRMDKLTAIIAKLRYLELSSIAEKIVMRNDLPISFELLEVNYKNA